MTATNPSTGVEEREIDLLRAEDRQLFRESAEAVAAEGMRCEEAARRDDYRRLTDGEMRGSEVFVVLREKLDQLHRKVKECDRLVLAGQVVENAMVDELQQLYDNLRALRDHILDHYGADEEKAVPSPDTSRPTEQSNRPQPTISEETAVLPVAAASLEQLPKRETVDVEVLRSLAMIRAEIARMQGLRERYAAVDDPALFALLTELEQNNARIKQLEERIRDATAEHEEPAVIKAKINTYTRVAREIQKNIDGLEQALTQAYKQKTEAEHTIVRSAPSSEPKSDFAPSRITDDANREVPPDRLKEYQAASVPSESDGVAAPTSVFEDRPVTHKHMAITPDNEGERSVPIVVAKPPESRASQVTGQKERPRERGKLSELAAKLNAVRDDRRVIAQTERRDPVNQAVAGNGGRVTRSLSELSRESLTAKYLTAPQYQTFIATYYTSPAAFEKVLDLTITQLESSTTDPIERWLGEKAVSPFTRLQHKTIAEVERLAEQPDLRERLVRAGIKYETFILWIDLIGEMMSVTKLDTSVTFGQLYATWVIESEMAYATQWQQQHSNAQIPSEDGL